MTIEEIKAVIQDVFSGTYTSQIYFVLKKDGVFSLRLADIESISTEPEIRLMFSEYISTSILKNDELSLCELSTADDRRNAIFHYDFEEYPEELGFFKDFDIGIAVKKAEKFDFTKDSLSFLHGYIIYLGSMERGIVLYKKHYHISLIKRDSFLLGAIKAKNRFERLAGEDIIRLNGASQLLMVADEVFVGDLKVLEDNLGFNNLMFSAAEDTISTIEDIKLLDDIQVLKDSAEDVVFARKLSKVKKSSPIFKFKIPKELIIEFSKNTPGLAGMFKYSEDGSSIRLDTKKSKDAFIKLLNDSYLRSELTKQYYEARAKDNITQ
jgi:hypothetical protein